jgi:hypothetical protein
MAKADSVLDSLADPADPQARGEAHRLLFAALATGYQTAFADADRPDFVPSVSSVLNTVGVNPDFIYGAARIDGGGVYRLSGQRGDGVFVRSPLPQSPIQARHQLSTMSMTLVRRRASTLGAVTSRSKP